MTSTRRMKNTRQAAAASSLLLWHSYANLVAHCSYATSGLSTPQENWPNYQYTAQTMLLESRLVFFGCKLIFSWQQTRKCDVQPETELRHTKQVHYVVSLHHRWWSSLVSFLQCSLQHSLCIRRIWPEQCRKVWVSEKLKFILRRVEKNQKHWQNVTCTTPWYKSGSLLRLIDGSD